MPIKVKAPPIETAEQEQQRKTIETIANNILGLAKAVQAMVNGPLKKKALIVLLAHSSGESQRATESIITAMENLGTDWLNKK